VAKTIGSIVGKFIKIASSVPELFGTAILLMMTPAKWIINGLALAKGFNMGARVGGGGGGGGGFGKTATKGGFTRGPNGKPTKMSRMQKLGGGKMMGGKYAAGSKGAIRGGMGLGIAGMGLSAARGMLPDENSGAGKAMGVASSALSGAGMGMMLGPLGALAGALIGGAYGAIQEFGGPKPGKQASTVAKTTKGKFNDAWVSGGEIQPIDSKDKVFEVSKPGGAFDKARASSSGSSGSNTMHVTFDDIIVRSADGNTGKIDLKNDSAFMMELAAGVKVALSKSANGGVLSPNPS